MKPKCKWCEEESSEGIPVAPYVVKINHVNNLIFGCYECIQEKTDPQDRTPVLLPDGWSVIDDSKLAEYEEQRRALQNVTIEMEKVEGIPDGRYYPHPAGRLNDIFDRLKNEVEYKNRFIATLGLEHAIADAMLSGAYCPACKSPLITTSQQVLSMAISDIVAGEERRFTQIEGFATRKKRSFVCLGCLTSYIEDRDYE